ncbi:MAG: hypothetical protein IPO39_07565 [Bacteroidetes bacterium]|nr:hypothetical protein [Bacteroidota bacterium]MBK9542047.1 hypothetical protein [Bacteroidota bacterium]MBP6648025.1 hypothetical protein [Bacteroidia bacterium]
MFKRKLHILIIIQIIHVISNIVHRQKVNDGRIGIFGFALLIMFDELLYFQDLLKITHRDQVAGKQEYRDNFFHAVNQSKKHVLKNNLLLNRNNWDLSRTQID